MAEVFSITFFSAIMLAAGIYFSVNSIHDLKRSWKNSPRSRKVVNVVLTIFGFAAISLAITVFVTVPGELDEIKSCESRGGQFYSSRCVQIIDLEE